MEILRLKFFSFYAFIVHVFFFCPGVNKCINVSVSFKQLMMRWRKFSCTLWYQSFSTINQGKFHVNVHISQILNYLKIVCRQAGLILSLVNHCNAVYGLYHYLDSGRLCFQVEPLSTMSLGTKPGHQFKATSTTNRKKLHICGKKGVLTCHTLHQ